MLRLIMGIFIALVMVTGLSCYYDNFDAKNLTKKDIPVLIQRLQKGNPLERRNAAVYLGYLGPDASDAIPALIEALGDSYKDSRYMSLIALAAIGPNAADAIPELGKLLDSNDSETRRTVAYTLAKIGPAARPLLPKLFELLQDKSPEVRDEAASSINRIGMDYDVAADYLPLFIEALTDEGNQVRSLSFGTLSHIKGHDNDTLPALKTALENEKDNNVIEDDIRSIWEIGDGKEIFTPCLMGLLDNDEPRVINAAIYALGGIGPPAKDALPKLDEIARKAGPDSYIYVEAKVAIAEIDGVQAVIALIDDDNIKIRSAAVWALSYYGSEAAEALPKLRELKAKEGSIDFPRDLPLIIAEIEGLPSLIRFIRDDKEDLENRANAASYIGTMGPQAKEAIPALIEIIKSENFELLRGAASALGMIGPDAKDAVPALIEALDLDTLLQFKPQNTEDNLQGPWELRRSQASFAIPGDQYCGMKIENYNDLISALGDIGPDAAPALPKLMKIAGSDDFMFFRFAAWGAIMKINKGQTAVTGGVRYY